MILRPPDCIRQDVAGQQALHLQIEIIGNIFPLSKSAERCLYTTTPLFRASARPEFQCQTHMPYKFLSNKYSRYYVVYQNIERHTSHTNTAIAFRFSRQSQNMLYNILFYCVPVENKLLICSAGKNLAHYGARTLCISQ